MSEREREEVIEAARGEIELFLFFEQKVFMVRLAHFNMQDTKGVQKKTRPLFRHFRRKKWPKIVAGVGRGGGRQLWRHQISPDSVQSRDKAERPGGHGTRNVLVGPSSNRPRTRCSWRNDQLNLQQSPGSRIRNLKIPYSFLDQLDHLTSPKGPNDVSSNPPKILYNYVTSNTGSQFDVVQFQTNVVRTNGVAASWPQRPEFDHPKYWPLFKLKMSLNSRSL